MRINCPAKLNQSSVHTKVGARYQNLSSPKWETPATKKLHSLSIMTKCNIEKFNRDTVKLYDDSASPEFLVVIKATPN